MKNAYGILEHIFTAEMHNCIRPRPSMYFSKVQKAKVVLDDPTADLEPVFALMELIAGAKKGLYSKLRGEATLALQELEFERKQRLNRLGVTI